MTRRERVYTAVQHREPDRVPKGEIEIARRLSRRLLGISEQQFLNDGIPFEKQKYIREQLGMDLVVVEMVTPESPCMEKGPAGRELIRDVWGNVRIRSAGTDVYGAGPVKPAITDVRDLKGYRLPNVNDFSGSDIATWSNETDFFVFALMGGIFETARALIGLEKLSLHTYSNFPELLDFVKRLSTFNAELARKAVACGAHAILISDDMAYNTGTFFSPTMLRKLFFPAVKMQVKWIKEEEVPVFLHSDGNIKEILQDIVDCGFDGLHALQPSAGMSLAKVKRDYGDHLCLMGNIDLDHILPFASPPEVKQAVREAIKSAACGGGYILSSCNVLTQDIPTRNVLAMYEAAEEYGHYPISLTEC